MAGSRVEKFGTIYSRMKGLIRSGAIKDNDKPIWYSIYEAFPPRSHQPGDEAVPVRNILYGEDVIRAKFYKTFGNADVVDLTNDVKTTCQKFIDQYNELDGEDGEQLFHRTTELLRERGTRLKEYEHVKLQRQLDSAESSEVFTEEADTNRESVVSQLMRRDRGVGEDLPTPPPQSHDDAAKVT